MELKEIRQFSEINAERRNPDIGEDGLFPKWNDSSKKFDYTIIGEGDIDETYLEEFITSIYAAPTEDDYLKTVTYTPTGGASSSTWVNFNMNKTATKTLKLGALAWLDEFEVPDLPGDTKILYDAASTIGGSNNFKYNYTTKKLLLTDVPITFAKTTEGATFKEGVNYLGGNSWAFGAGVAPSGLGNYNISTGYKSGRGLGSTSEYNTLYGSHSGEYLTSTVKGTIGIGTYAARYETSNNRFFLDNIDYLNTSDARDGSFLYGDLETERRLYVRDHLAVTKEIKLGDSGLTNEQAATLVSSIGGSLIQVVPDGDGYKPQFHDGTIWKDFAVGDNHYLQEVSEDPVTEGLWHFIVKDSTGVTTIEDFTLQLPLLTDVDVPIASSPSYPGIQYGYIQISNASSGTNGGFYYKTGFKWDNTLGELNVPGAFKMASKGIYSASNGVIRYDESLKHFYGKVNDAWKQLDNSDFEEITGLNIGNATYEVFKQKNSDGKLELRTFKPRVDTTYNPYDRITINYADDGDSILIGTTAELNRLTTTIGTVDDRYLERSKTTEYLPIRALRQGAGIILTQTEEYIQFDVTGVPAGGESNTCSNLGNVDIFYRKNGLDFEFFGLHANDDRLSITQGVALNPNSDFSVNLEIVGLNETVVTNPITSTGNVFWKVTDSEGTTPTLHFRPLISDSLVFTETANNELQIEVAGGPSTITPTNEGDVLFFEVFDDTTSTASSFLFRRLGAVTDKHITLDYGISSEDITFEVDDITLTALGANPKLITQDGTDSFIFSQKGITGSNGVTITTTSLTDIDFSIPNIEKLQLDGSDFYQTIVPSGSFDSYGSTGEATIQFQVGHAEITNTSTTYTNKTIATLNVGGAIKYDAATNTIWSETSEGMVDTNHYLQEIEEDLTDPDNFIYTFHVGDINGVSPTINPREVAYPLVLNIPKSSVPIASYTDYLGAIGTRGTVKVEEFTAEWVLGDTVPLYLDIVTGRIAANKLMVTYDVQNNLHDIDNIDEVLFIPPGTNLNINTLRSNARANIGASYINGAVTENFDARSLSLSNGYSTPASAGQLRAGQTSVIHELGKIRVGGNVIYDGINNQLSIYNSSSGESKLRLSPTTIRVELPTSGALEVYSKAGVKLMRLDSSGNLDIAGELRANQDITAFDTDSTL